MDGIFIGMGGGKPQAIDLKRANRHGLIAGATGTGKTVTLQTMVEGFSRAGVPSFVADVKGDLSGLGLAGSALAKTHAAFAARAAELGMTDWSYDALNAEAAALPPGSDGVLVQDHFQGNRTPHTDAASRGAFTGLTLAHGRAHLFRAAMEGVAFGTELIFETMRAGGYRPDEIVICGGATRSDLWMQIHADVCGQPLTVTEVGEAPALGSAILAAKAAGHYGSIEEAAGAALEPLRRRARIGLQRHRDHRGEEHRLRRVHRERAFAEVDARCLFCAEDAVAPLDEVQVQLEDPVLFDRAFESIREDRLAQLAHGVARRR